MKWKKTRSDGKELTTWTSDCGNFTILSYDWNKKKNYTLYGSHIPIGGHQFINLTSAQDAAKNINKSFNTIHT